jgi:hypothetical protein
MKVCDSVPCMAMLQLVVFWVVFTTTLSLQSELFRSTVFESSRQLQTYTTTGEGSGSSGLRLVSAVWLRVFDVYVSPVGYVIMVSGPAGKRPFHDPSEKTKRPSLLVLPLVPVSPLTI